MKPRDSTATIRLETFPTHDQFSSFSTLDFNKSSLVIVGDSENVIEADVF